MGKTKQILFVALLGFSISASAGWLSFFGDVASISSAMGSGRQGVSQSDLKAVNKYLWKMVEEKEYVDGYEFLAEALEESNNVSYLDTAAQAYFDNGQKEKAMELYETRVLPIARATCRSCESFYKKMTGLSAEANIPYSDIYIANQKRQKERFEASIQEKETPTVEYAIWGILLMLMVNFLMKLGIIPTKSANKAQ